MCNSDVGVKRGTTPTLQVYLDGVDLAEVKSVTFLFKRNVSERLPALLEKTVENPEANPVEVELTMEETYALDFPEIWMDTRIVLSSGKVPPTELVQLSVGATLFAQEGQDGGTGDD